MTPIVAALLCIAAIAAGFVLEHRERRARVTLAAWLPWFWMAINASRSVGQWVGTRSLYEGGADEASQLRANLGGSPVDGAVLGTVIALGALVILSRRGAVERIVRDNKWLLVFVLYLGASVLWSDIPVASLRRWVGLAGHLVMAGVLVSEPAPLESVRMVFRRCAYFLIPISVLFVKYFPDLGLLYMNDGHRVWTGAAIMKNGLGHLALVFTFFVIWDLLTRKARGRPTGRLSTIFDVTIIAMGLYLLRAEGTNSSAAAIACMVLVVAVLVASRLPVARRAFARSSAVVVIGACLFVVVDSALGVIESLVGLLGRDMTFTGRVPLWNTLMDFGFRSPVYGYGYGGFWTVGRATVVAARAGALTQAHNGYLDVFLEGGFLGLVLLVPALILVLMKIQRTNVKDYDYGVLRLSFFALVLITNVTESCLARERGLMSFLFFMIAMNDGVRLQSWVSAALPSPGARGAKAAPARHLYAVAAVHRHAPGGLERAPRPPGGPSRVVDGTARGRRCS